MPALRFFGCVVVDWLRWLVKCLEVSHEGHEEHEGSGEWRVESGEWRVERSRVLAVLVIFVGVFFVRFVRNARVIVTKLHPDWRALISAAGAHPQRTSSIRAMTSPSMIPSTTPIPSTTSANTV